MARSSTPIAVRPLRILHIIVHLSAGGAELMMKRLILAQRGAPQMEHAVISLRGLGSVGPELRAAGINVTALELNAPYHLPKGLAKLVRLIRRMQPDVVQTWMYHADFLGGIAARMAGKAPVVWNVRIAQIAPEFGVARATRWVMKACAMLSRLVPAKIVYVARSARRVHEGEGYDPAKSLVIANGYALPPLASADSSRMRTELGLAPEALLIGSAGRFNKQKNHRSFIVACEAVAAAHPQAHFILFGSGLDAENLELAQWIAATGRADRFHLMGERADLPRLMPALDIFCLHSLSEGLPNVVAEAMAAAVPCVVTDVGDAALLVADTGWVVPPADEAALANALGAALRLDAAVRADYGSRARFRIESEFSMAAIADEYVRLYREVAGRALPTTSGAA